MTKWNTFLVLMTTALVGCSDVEMRASAVVMENSKGGTYDAYWTPFQKAAEYAEENCSRYGKNAVFTVRDERLATFECR